MATAAKADERDESVDILEMLESGITLVTVRQRL
jgi:hypothetical protein